MNPSRILYALLLPLLLLAGSAHAANLALNPGMEDWQTTECLHWTAVDGASYVQSSTAHAGSYALRVQPSAAYNGVNQNGTAVIAGHTYVIKCWLRGAASGDVQPLRLMVYGYQEGGTPVFPANSTTGALSDSTYTEYSLTFTAPAGLTAINLNIVPWDAPANSFSFLLDDVSFEEVEGGLILNGGMETWNGADCANWVAADGGALTQSAEGHAGSYALKVTPHGNYSGTNQGWIPVEAGASYALSCWIRGAQAGQTPGVRMMVYTTEASPAVFISKPVGTISATSYKQAVLRFTVPAGVTRLVLNVVAYNDTEGAFLLDDVKLRKVDTLVLNGDFESWTPGNPAGAEYWQATGQAATLAATTTALESARAIAVSPTETYGGLRQEDIPALGGTDYRLIVWLANALPGDDHPVRLLVIQPEVGWLGTSTEYASISSADQSGLSSNRWRKFVFDFTTYAPQTTDDQAPTHMHLELGSYLAAPTGGTFLVDKVWLGRRGVDSEPADPTEVDIGPQAPSAAAHWTLY